MILPTTFINLFFNHSTLSQLCDSLMYSTAKVGEESIKSSEMSKRSSVVLRT
jgi:hypothetical protein